MDMRGERGLRDHVVLPAHFSDENLKFQEVKRLASVTPVVQMELTPESRAPNCITL